jgi:hypothetical protein
MQIIKTFLVASIFILPSSLVAQSTLFQQGSKENILLDRLEIKMQKDSLLNFSFLKPYSRKWWFGALDRASDSLKNYRLSKVDKYNLSRSRLNNIEWDKQFKLDSDSKHGFLNSIYKTPADMISVREKDFFISVNPVLQLQAMKDDATNELRYMNTRGVLIRSLLADKIGFQAYVTETQEKPPVFLLEKVEQFRAVPGAGLYRRFKKTGYDYFDARGSVYFNATRFLDVQFGYDKIFLGNGYRSLFMSDYSSSHLFFNLNLHAGRFNYVSRVMELTSQYTRRIDKDTLFPKKYAVVHHVSFNAPKWLTLGLFESIVFGRQNHVEFSYLNPVMFLRPAELQVGSPDNSFVGFDAKANVGKRFQLYGQILIDEFYTKYIRQNNGWWGNKWAFQGGLKYIDVAGVKNLDLQLESNWIRPFTYSHFDTVGNYTHYNQPIAHPLMSNIREFIGILRFQPAPKWTVQAKAIYWQSGVDTAGKNFGNNIFLSNQTRAAFDGFFYGAPVSRKNLNVNFWLAYEFKENLFLESNVYYRKIEGGPKNIFSSFGLRWNMQRREYDY